MTGVFLGVLVFFPFLGGLLAAVAGKKHADYRDFLADIVVVFEFLRPSGCFPSSRLPAKQRLRLTEFVAWGCIFRQTASG